jgi:hypothetical protein
MIYQRLLKVVVKDCKWVKLGKVFKVVEGENIIEINSMSTDEKRDVVPFSKNRAVAV